MSLPGNLKTRPRGLFRSLISDGPVWELPAVLSESPCTKLARATSPFVEATLETSKPEDSNFDAISVTDTSELCSTATQEVTILGDTQLMPGRCCKAFFMEDTHVGQCRLASKKYVVMG